MSDKDSVEWLEKMLSIEKTKNKILQEKFDKLSRYILTQEEKIEKLTKEEPIKEESNKICAKVTIYA